MSPSTAPEASKTPPAPSDPSTGGVDKSGHRVRDMFAQIAPRYDLMNHVLSLGIDIRWRKKALRRLALTGNQAVLDCCTGTGDLAILLARHSQGRYQVVGSDFCAPMLDIAKRKADKQGQEVEFLEADAQQLPFADNKFQAVTCAFGLRNVQDTRLGLSEMKRVCIPGGQVGILEFSHPTAPGLKQLYQFYFRSVLPRVGQAVARNDKSAYEYLPNSVTEFPSGSDFLELMGSCGFSNMQQYPMTLGVATLYIGTPDK